MHQHKHAQDRDPPTSPPPQGPPLSLSVWGGWSLAPHGELSLIRTPSGAFWGPQGQFGKRGHWGMGSGSRWKQVMVRRTETPSLPPSITPAHLSGPPVVGPAPQWGSGQCWGAHHQPAPLPPSQPQGWGGALGARVESDTPRGSGGARGPRASSSPARSSTARPCWQVRGGRRWLTAVSPPPRSSIPQQQEGRVMSAGYK